MYCRNPECGAELEEGALFCGRCGTPAIENCLVCGEKLPARKTKMCPRCGTLMFEMRERAAGRSASAAAWRPPERKAPSEIYERPAASSGASGVSGAKLSPPSGGFDEGLKEKPPIRVEVVTPVPETRPMDQVKTDRSLGLLILFSILTLGIYDLVFMTSLASDVNRIASRHDGKKTMNFCLLFFLVAPLTYGIGALVWHHRISDRIGNELRRRGCASSFSSGTYWLWAVLGSVIIVGPLVYMHQLISAMNTLAADYNARG